MMIKSHKGQKSNSGWAWYIMPTVFIVSVALFSFLIWYGFRFFFMSFPITLSKLTINIYYIFYYIFVPILPIIFSIAVILVNNPIFSLFFLITLFFSSVLLLFSLQVEFLSMIYLIIYIGAISILFLFVIMMFNLKQLQKKQSTFFFWITILVYFWIMPKFYQLFIILLKQKQIITFRIIQKENPYYLLFDQRFDILIFSELFYTYYSYLFLLSGIILLSAMLGSIVLALSTVEN